MKSNLTGFAGRRQGRLRQRRRHQHGRVQDDGRRATEEVTVVAEAPLVDVKESGVGELITATQIENLPLNGRQFGEPGRPRPRVSLGFHTDPTKSTQFAPQVAAAAAATSTT